jgi:flagellar basal body rod protein FlgG
MNSQLYTAASGLVAEQRRLELIANNLANLATPGYRAQRSFSAALERFGPDADPAVRAANAVVAVAGLYETGAPVPSRATGRALDVALEREDVLAVETAAGRRYTRAGALEVSPAGELTDAVGHRVLGSGGQPLAGLGPAASVTPDGRVLEGENEIGRLLDLRDPRGVLRPEGEGLLAAPGAEQALEEVTSPQLRPGWLAGSSTDALGELVQLIEAQRAFESYQKLVSLTMNEINRRAVIDLAG